MAAPKAMPSDWKVGRAAAVSAGASSCAMAGAAATLRLARRCGHRDLAALLLAQGAEIPPGLSVDASILEQAALSAATDEVPVPRLPDALPDNMIEFTMEPGEPISADTSIPFRFSHDANFSATSSRP